MPKRAKRGEGSVYCRANGRWTAAIHIRDSEGERRKLERYADSRSEAFAELARMKEGHHRLGGASMIARETVSGFASRWLSILELSHATLKHYEHSLLHHVVPYLGRERLASLTTLQVLEWLAGMKRRDVGARARQMALAVFRRMCRAARLMRVISEDPTAGIPTPKAPRKDIVPFTRDEVLRILTAAQGHRYEAVFALAFFAGMRQEEIYGLQWSDIDWASRTLRIHRAVAEAWGKRSVKDAKTRCSSRVVPLHPFVLDLLRKRQASAAAERGPEHPWVFFGERGSLIRRSTFGDRQWKPLLAKAGVPPRGMHHTRHTLATTLLQAGTPVHIVSGLLGHSVTSTTMDVYCHFLPEDRTAVAEAIARNMNAAIPTGPASSPVSDISGPQLLRDLAARRPAPAHEFAGYCNGGLLTSSMMPSVQKLPLPSAP